MLVEHDDHAERAGVGGMRGDFDAGGLRNGLLRVVVIGGARELAGGLGGGGHIAGIDGVCRADRFHGNAFRRAGRGAGSDEDADDAGGVHDGKDDGFRRVSGKVDREFETTHVFLLTRRY